MIETEQLTLRQWRDSDRAPFAAMGIDPLVMEYFPSLLTREESDATVDRLTADIAKNGHGFWAVEVRGGPSFIGFIGIKKLHPSLSFLSAPELGWRLTPGAWGKGYATEGARASVRFAFETLGLDEITSFTVPTNVRSRAVMARLGMTHHPEEDFDHPLIADGHPLRRHVLYRLRATRGPDHARRP